MDFELFGIILASVTFYLIIATGFVWVCGKIDLPMPFAFFWPATVPIIGVLFCIVTAGNFLWEHVGGFFKRIYHYGEKHDKRKHPRYG